MLFTITATTGGNDASRVAALDLRTGTHKILVQGGSQAQYVPSGHLVYVASGTLRAVAFDLERLEVVGTPIPVVPQVVTLPNGTAEFDVADNGTLVYVPGGAVAPARTLVWVDRQVVKTAINVPGRAYVAPRLSPDGARVALEVRDQNNDIWVLDFARETLTRVTFDPGLEAAPTWMPDGRRMVFSSQPNEGAASLFWQAADGTGTAERLTQNPSRISVPVGGLAGRHTRPVHARWERDRHRRDVAHIGQGSPGATGGADTVRRAERGDLTRRPLAGVPVQRLRAGSDFRRAVSGCEHRALAGVYRWRYATALGKEW